MPSNSRDVFTTLLTANDVAAKETLGAIRTEDDGKKYIYGQFAVASVIGDVQAFASSNTYQITSTLAAGLIHSFAGVAVGTVTATYYGWAQRGGFCSHIHTDGNATAGCQLALTSNANKLCLPIASNLSAFGTAMAADSGSNLTAAMLNR